jgi:hypothetical protein
MLHTPLSNAHSSVPARQKQSPHSIVQKQLPLMTDYIQPNTPNLSTLDFMQLASETDKQAAPGESMPTPSSTSMEPLYFDLPQQSRAISLDEAHGSGYGLQIDWRGMGLGSDVHDLLTGLY